MRSRPVARFLLILPLAWYPLCFLHECGHALSAWLGGASGIAIVWHAGFLPETLRDGSRWPLADAWAGPVAGAVLPVLGFLVLRRTRVGDTARHLAAITCLGHGLYLGCGWLDTGNDADQLRRLGVPVTMLLAAGAMLLGGGLRLLLAAAASVSAPPAGADR